MGVRGAQTITTMGNQQSPSRSTCAALFIVVTGDDPYAAGSRHLLRNVDRVFIGRGAARTARRIRSDGIEELHLEIPDGRVSVKHARLERALGSWTVIDLGSKNGLIVRGERQACVALADGDWIEIGHTFLRYREEVKADDPLDVDAVAEKLRTLVPAYQAELDRLTHVAAKNVPVLLRGETGTGKEVLARTLHALSRRAGPFVALNCGAIPASLVEDTLFGHRRGAFSGASEDRPGVVRSADRGTLLLDEIGDLPLAQQAAFLRVLQEREVVPVGETRPVKVDIRVIAASHRDLDEQVKRGELRADLLARIAGIRVAVPPLRERLEDLGILIAAILERAEAPRCTLTREAIWALCRHRWPLNVRELEQALVAALAQMTTETIGIEHLPDALRVGPPVAPKRDGVRRAELVALLREHDNNLAAVARALRTSRAQVHRLLQRFGVDARAPR